MRLTSKKGILSRPTVQDRYRSGLERRIATQLDGAKVPFTYESCRFKYVVPAREAKYTPDFHLNERIYIESKGYFREAADRQKLVLFKQQNPEIDLRLVFQKATNPIYKGSPTTYAKWAEDNGFLWADGGRIPDSWIKEALSDHQHPSGLPRSDRPDPEASRPH